MSKRRTTAVRVIDNFTFYLSPRYPPFPFFPRNRFRATAGRGGQVHHDQGISVGAKIRRE